MIRMGKSNSQICQNYFSESLKLQPKPESYGFLNKSGCIEADTVNDDENFKLIKVIRVL